MESGALKIGLYAVVVLSLVAFLASFDWSLL